LAGLQLPCWYDGVVHATGVSLDCNGFRVMEQRKNERNEAKGHAQSWQKAQEESKEARIGSEGIVQKKRIRR